jgi:hypothetical protein
MAVLTINKIKVCVNINHMNIEMKKDKKTIDPQG